MKSSQNLSGNKFGRLTVIECMGKDKGRNVIWKCLCNCGKEIVCRGSALLHGTTQSCGCLLKDSPARIAAAKARGKSIATHGMFGTPTWVSWNSMMQRCLNAKRLSYKHYGARGIVPCESVKSSPKIVIDLIGERPENRTLDRVNNNSGYTCGKCPECLEKGWVLNIRWATNAEQACNKRTNHFVTIFGVARLRHEWAKELGVTIGVIRGYEKKQERLLAAARLMLCGKNQHEQHSPT